MKKLLTFFFCTGLATAAFAQSDRERTADVILRGGSQQTTSNSGSRSSCQARIDAINRRYDEKVAAIRAENRFPGSSRDAQITLAEQERSRKIDEVNRNCANRSSSGNYGKYRNKAKSKGNNGNHYGWEKGKGNPHGSGNNWKGKGKNKKDD